MKGYALSVSRGFVDTADLQSHLHPNLSLNQQKCVFKYSINPKTYPCEELNIAKSEDMCRPISAYWMQMCCIYNSNSLALIYSVLISHRETWILPGWPYWPSASRSSPQNSTGSKAGCGLIPMLKVSITVEMFAEIYTMLKVFLRTLLSIVLHHYLHDLKNLKILY